MALLTYSSLTPFPFCSYLATLIQKKRRAFLKTFSAPFKFTWSCLSMMGWTTFQSQLSITVDKSQILKCNSLTEAKRQKWRSGTHFLSTAISFSMLLSFPFSAFLGMHLTAKSFPLALSSAKTTSENAPLKEKKKNPGLKWCFFFETC